MSSSVTTTPPAKRRVQAGTTEAPWVRWTLLGIAFAGERIATAEWLAMVVIVGGVVLIGLPQWRRGQ